MQGGWGPAPLGFEPETAIMSILIAPQDGVALDIDIDYIELY
jgi:hypothetical protein